MVVVIKLKFAIDKLDLESSNRTRTKKPTVSSKLHSSLEQVFTFIFIFLGKIE